MMRAAFVFAFTLIAAQANAADHALMLTDEEISGLRQVLDLAVKQSGMQVAPFAVYMNNKLNAAGIVTERKEPAKESSGDHIPEKPTEKRDGK